MEDVTLLFTLGTIPLKKNLSHPCGVASHLKLLGLVIPYSGNPKGRLYTVLALATFS